VQLHTQLATVATFRGLHARAAEHYQYVLRHHGPRAPVRPRSSFGGDPLVVASLWSSRVWDRRSHAPRRYSSATRCGGGGNRRYYRWTLTISCHRGPAAYAIFSVSSC
jgi:hypothetical protein